VRAALDDSREVYVLTYSRTISPMTAGITKSASRAPARESDALSPGVFAPTGDEAAVATLAENLTHTLDSPLDVAEIGIQASSKVGWAAPTT